MKLYAISLFLILLLFVQFSCISVLYGFIRWQTVAIANWRWRLIWTRSWWRTRTWTWTSRRVWRRWFTQLLYSLPSLSIVFSPTSTSRTGTVYVLFLAWRLYCKPTSLNLFLTHLLYCTLCIIIIFIFLH